MALLALFLFVLVALALPGLWPRLLGLSSTPPDAWVALVVYLALRGRGYQGVGWAIALGALEDSLSLDAFGTHAFILGVVAFALCEGRRPRAPVEGLGRLVATFGAAVAAGWLYVLRLLPLGSPAVEGADVLHAFPAALWTTVFAAGLFPILDHFHVFDDLVGRTRGLPA